ncbi:MULTISPECIES: RagB/SusD family nutrient uptake outer membrane protein [Sphingobacterium]|uniref:RagB/SusD family nutrient uptake outer membrane protein n=1 Tax=Sphingobacterium TaxID=28453 RepID=UPI002180CB04|nr:MULTISPECIES: RagB/SusD family nutrient uptake outer membrane protein [Sphingobacterium]MBB1645478.1 starch-binding protein [Sphingobacterium sp. UME9]
MMNIKLFNPIMTLLLATTVLSGCTKLDEEVFSQIEKKNFYNNRNEVTAAILRPYTHIGASLFSWGGQRNFWRLNELSADQLALPQKGNDWYNGGEFFRLHYHTWTASELAVENAYNLLYRGIGFCNNILMDLETLDAVKVGMTVEELKSAKAETRVMRAFIYMKLMDLFGDIALVTQVGTPLSPERKPKKEVFDFIEKEVTESAESLPILSKDQVGRISKAAAYAILSELYLNAETWTGQARWDDCVSASDMILNGKVGGQNGTAALANDLTSIFSPSNNESNEVLFSIAYDYVAAKYRFQWNNDLWHYNQKEVYNADQTGNNGIVVIPTAYDAFVNNDLRKSTWMLIGPQYKKGTSTPILGAREYKNKPLVFVKEIQRNSTGDTKSDMSQGEENSGARFNKYVPGAYTDKDYWSNDQVIYRLAEIYFNKAEALMRKNNKNATSEAVELINTVRKRAFSVTDWPTAQYTTSSLTLEELLAERGREFIFEGKRRTDLIRFGKFETATWWDHKPTVATKKVFPIPSQQIAANPNMVQNLGY